MNVVKCDVPGCKAKVRESDNAVDFVVSGIPHPDPHAGGAERITAISHARIDDEERPQFPQITTDAFTYHLCDEHKQKLYDLIAEDLAGLGLHG